MSGASLWTFFRQWLKSPLRTAAVAPSSRNLAAAMMAELPPGARCVIELGGGTGALTKHLLEEGIEPSRLLVLELSEELHEHLRRRFPRVTIALADARDLREVLRSTGFAEAGAVDAVVSGLGLLSMVREAQHAILAAAFDCLSPEGRFIQFTYGPNPPVSADVVAALGLEVLRGDFVLRNVPPARVFVYRRRA